MLELKTKKELSGYAFKLAQGLNLVRYRNVTYIPADYETRETSIPPDIDRTIWLPLNRARVQQLGASDFDILFGSDSELSSFEFMVAQSAIQIDKAIDSLLVRTPSGLCELDNEGALVQPTGDFRPNALVPMLNEDAKEKERIFKVVCDWLDSEEEAESLLRHLATSLAPGWSAVKYMLLLGEGRNGKGLLLKMVHGLFGVDNVSGVSRQAMATNEATVTELNGKLLNIIYDGKAKYLEDSGTEKTLVAGEPVAIRRLYESTGTVVQTNALFVESLNREPKTGDKSMALQKRLVRFQFPNIYKLDKRFEKLMLREETLGAFLSLLIDHYVKEDEVAERLALTTKAIELQLEQLYVNSMGLQFLKYVEESDALGTQSLLGIPVHDLAARFKSWRLKENDLGTWAEPDVLALFQPLLNTERKSDRQGPKVTKVRRVTSFKLEAAAFIDTLKGGVDPDEALIDALVED